jgi:hypothetical protein
MNPLDDAVEVAVKYSNGKVKIYKNIETFIENILDSYELSGEEVAVPTKPGVYTGMSISYKEKDNRSPADIAKDMQKQAAGVLKF